jgi:hypothetical protein
MLVYVSIRDLFFGTNTTLLVSTNSFTTFVTQICQYFVPQDVIGDTQKIIVVV